VSDVGTILDLSWKLLLVLGLAVLAMRALRWLSNPPTRSDSALKLLVRLPIGPQQSLLLVAVGKKRILIGQSPQQVVLLSELALEDLAGEDEDLDAGGGMTLPGEGRSLDFRTLVKHSLTSLTSDWGRGRESVAPGLLKGPRPRPAPPSGAKGPTLQDHDAKRAGE
jgi:flagellar biogenesis protein FliO